MQPDNNPPVVRRVIAMPVVSEQAHVCARLFVASSGLLRGLIHRLPFATLRYADRQRLKRALTHLEADLHLARTALGFGPSEMRSKKAGAALPETSVTEGR